MGRKPGVPNKPKPGTGIGKADVIMAVVHDLSDRELQAALFMRSLEKLNSAGKIEVCRYMISLYELPLKYVKPGVTLSECEHAINGLNKTIKELQREQEEQKEGQEADTDDDRRGDREKNQRLSNDDLI